MDSVGRNPSFVMHIACVGYLLSRNLVARSIGNRELAASSSNSRDAFFTIALPSMVVEFERG